MGDDDVQFAPLLGMYLGWQNPGIVPFGFLFLGFIAGAIVGLVVMAIGKAGRKTAPSARSRSARRVHRRVHRPGHGGRRPREVEVRLIRRPPTVDGDDAALAAMHGHGRAGTALHVGNAAALEPLKGVAGRVDPVRRLP